MYTHKSIKQQPATSAHEPFLPISAHPLPHGSFSADSQSSHPAEQAGKEGKKTVIKIWNRNWICIALHYINIPTGMMRRAMWDEEWSAAAASHRVIVEMIDESELSERWTGTSERLSCVRRKGEIFVFVLSHLRNNRHQRNAISRLSTTSTHTEKRRRVVERKKAKRRDENSKSIVLRFHCHDMDMNTSVSWVLSSIT